MNIPTAEKLCRIEYDDDRPSSIFMERSVDMKWAIFMMQQFAKLHCIEQARVISEKATASYYDKYVEHGVSVNKKSILNAYSLDLIK